MTDRICADDPQCERPIFGKGLCATHYHRRRRLQADDGRLPICGACGEPFIRTRSFRLYCSDPCLPRCASPECSDRVQAKGMCGRHYTEAKRGPLKRPAPEPCPSKQAYRRGCRCDGCTEANRLYVRERTGGNPIPPLDERPHGGTRYAKQGCRCEICRAGNAERGRSNSIRNPGPKKRAQQASNAKRKSAPFTVEARDYLTVINSDPCSYCPKPGESVDHIVPICAGGSGDWWNLTAACRRCNSSKKEKSLLTFLLYQCRIEDQMKLEHPDAPKVVIDVTTDRAEPYISQGWVEAEKPAKPSK